MIPKISMYNIASLDGRIDWVLDTLESMFTYYELAFHWKVDAILMGSNTVMAFGEHESEEEAVEMPKPTQNNPPAGTENLIYEPKPLLVIADSKGQVHNLRLLQKEPWWRDIVILCSEKTPNSYFEYLEKRHAGYIIAGKEQVDLKEALEKLNEEYGVRSIRTDSGGTLNGILLREGLIDEVSVLISPKMVGGKNSRTIFDAPDLTSFDGVVNLKLTHMEKIKENYVWLRYQVMNGKADTNSYGEL